MGFGAQSLIKDVISGFFTIFENSYCVGDYIQASGVSGFCEEVGLRITKLRDWDGELHVIPNGQITTITNYSRGDVAAYVEIPVPYHEDLPYLFGLIEKALSKVGESGFIAPPRILGVDKLEDTRVIIKLAFTAKLADRSSLSRKLRQACKEEFDAAGIAMPCFFPVLGADRRQDNA